MHARAYTVYVNMIADVPQVATPLVSSNSKDAYSDIDRGIRNDDIDHDVDIDRAYQLQLRRDHGHGQPDVYVDSNSCACSVSSDAYANIGVHAHPEQSISESFAAISTRTENRDFVERVSECVRARAAPLAARYKWLQQSLESASNGLLAGVQKIQSGTWARQSRQSAFVYISCVVLVLAFLDLFLGTAHTF